MFRNKNTLCSPHTVWLTSIRMKKHWFIPYWENVRHYKSMLCNRGERWYEKNRYIHVTIHRVRLKGQKLFKFMLECCSWQSGWKHETLFISLLFDHGLQQMCNDLWSEMNDLFHDEMKWNKSLTRHTRWDVLQHWEVISLVLWGNRVFGKGRNLLEKVWS